MRIALLCKRYYTNKDLIKDKFGRLYHLPVQLARLGHDINVIAIDYRNTKVAEYTLDGVTFKTLPATVSQLPFVPYRAYSALSNTRSDILVASGDSHIGYIGWQISRLLSSRFVFDVYDYYPAFKGNRIPYMEAMFMKAVQNANIVLCASSSLQQKLNTINESKWVVPNGVNPEQFNPGDLQTARDALGAKSSETLIGYFGSITPTRGPILIDACSILYEKIPSLRLLLAGRVTNVDISAPWIDYRGELPQEVIAPLIRACDVVTIPYAEEPFNSMSGACKIAEYLACGRPVVATRVSNHKDLFRDAPGSICEPDANSMAQVLRRQLHAPEIAPFPVEMTWEAIAQALHYKLT